MRGQRAKPDGPKAYAASIVDSKPSKLARAWDNLPRAGKWLAVGLGSLAAVAACTWFVMGVLLAPEREPAALPDQCQRLAEAFLRNQSKQVEALATSSSKMQALPWLQQARPQAWPAPHDNEQVSYLLQKGFNAADTLGGKRVEQAMMTLTIQPPRAAPSKATPVEVLTYWTREPEQDWLLDLQRTGSASRGTR